MTAALDRVSAAAQALNGKIDILLRQCVRKMPGYRLVEADDYLPRN